MTKTDEQTERAFRSAYATVLETSPIPLEWDDLVNQPVPLTPPNRANRFRRPIVAFSAAAVLVFATAIAVTLGATSDPALMGAGSDQWRAILFLSDGATPVEIDAVADELQDLDGVTRWLYVDRDMALNEALALFADDERQIGIILEDPSILPRSLRFAAVDEESARAVVRMAAELVNQGETAIVDGIVARGPLVSTDPDDSTVPGPSLRDFVVTTTTPPPP